jgi:hypothetical protein
LYHAHRLVKGDATAIVPLLVDVRASFSKAKPTRLASGGGATCTPSVWCST